MVKLIIGLSFVWKKYWCKPCVSIDFWMDGHLHRTLSVSMMKCVSHQDVSMREGLHFCKSSSQLAYLSCWREREVIRTTSVLFICVSKLLSPAVCSTLTSVKGKTLFLWQPLCCCNCKWLCLSSGAAYTLTHILFMSPPVSSFWTNIALVFCFIF